MGRSGEIWGGLARSGEIWRGLARSGEIWRDLARSGEIWRDVGCRARMASAAPSMGLRRDHIGFRLVFVVIFVKNVRKCIFGDSRSMFDRFSVDLR